MQLEPQSDLKLPLIVLLTGVSGAGLRTATDALSDLGFYGIDNLPLEMIPHTLQALKGTHYKNFKGYAFGIHIHDQQTVEQFLTLKYELEKACRLDILFLTADNAVLIDRYSSTRRPHPLLRKGGNFRDVVCEEMNLLQPIEALADVILDTTKFSNRDLVAKLAGRYAGDVPARVLNVSVVSFGFKHGQYWPSDSIHDVRFLPNPHFQPSLRQKTGADQEVIDFIMNNEVSREYLERLVDINAWLLPKYYAEGKHYFRIGIGCTGGRHRSVCFATKLGEQLTNLKIPNVIVNIAHRDIMLAT
jgi:UPF0042 nucleotide-binding protein